MLSKNLVFLILFSTALELGQAQTSARGHAVPASGKIVKPAAKGNAQRHIQSQLEQLRDEMKRQHDDMKRQIQDLQQQLSDSRELADKTQQSVVNATQAVEQTETSSQAAISTSNETIASLQGAVSDLKTNTTSLAAALKEGAEKSRGATENPIAIRYKGVKLSPGGFVAADAVWRQHQVQADVATPFGTLPFDGTPMARLTEFRLSARQTRISMLAETGAGNVSLAGYVELDMLGAGLTSNSNESNSYLPRLRHAWLQSTWKNGWSLAGGQMWTLAQANRKGINSLVANAYLPDTIEAQYVVGLDWLRQPSLRVVKNIDNRIWIAASAEGAQTTFSARNAPANFLFGCPGTSNLTSTVNYSFDKAPDIIAKLAFEPGFGHYELKGVARFFRDRVYPGAPASAAGAYNDSPLGGGVGAAASWNFARKVDFSLNALLGNGVGRYGTSQLPDVTVRPDGTLAPLHGGQGLGMLEFNPNPRWKLYAYGGQEYAGRRAFLNSKGVAVG
jgi:hypothetical protein